MINVGKVCMKIAGRDAGKICVITKIMDENFVMIDGQTRRRKCNLTHLEILKKDVDISEDASNADVVKALKAINIDVVEKAEIKSKDKVKPQKVKKSKTTSGKTDKKPAKKSTEKVAKPKADKKPAKKSTKED